jgi:hypothetical protein
MVLLVLRNCVQAISVSKGWSVTEKKPLAKVEFRYVMQQAETVRVWGDAAGCLVKLTQKQEQLDTTTWVFDDDYRSLPRSRRKLAPPKASLPTELSTYEYATSADGVDENLLLLLHGLGDSHLPYAKLATTLALPQVKHTLATKLFTRVRAAAQVDTQTPPPCVLSQICDCFLLPSLHT